MKAPYHPFINNFVMIIMIFLITLINSHKNFLIALISQLFVLLDENHAHS
jgi:hypothetical protein